MPRSAQAGVVSKTSGRADFSALCRHFLVGRGDPQSEEKDGLKWYESS
jgi:hypothetical protein